MTSLQQQEGNEQLWFTVFAEGHPVLVKKQRRYQMLPGSPRCKLCAAPFGGAGGWLMRLRGLGASHRNPQYCTACDAFLEAFPGGAEVPMAMMMVDIRDSVSLSGQVSAREFAALVMDLRDEVAKVLDQTEGFLLEFQGDSVFAVWPPGFVGADYAAKALKAADLAGQMIRKRAEGRAAPVGIAVHAGKVFIGAVSAAGGRIQGISAFGLEVNVLARLAAAAQPGEILASAATYAAAGHEMPTATRRHEVLKGVSQPVEVAVV